MESILFSIIIPLYNKEKSIHSTIQSVLSQSYPNFELIIVNDGSTDMSLAVAKSFSDKRIRFIVQTNRGVSNARNNGIKASKNEYIIPLDADDLWLPNALDEFLYLIQNFPRAEVFVTNHTIEGKDLKGSKRRYYVDDFFYTSAVLMAKWNVGLMATGIVALQKDCFKKIGYYDEYATHGEDIDLWMRLSKNFQIAKSEVVTMIYRLDAENRASKILEANKKFPERLFIKEEIKDKSHQLFLGCEFLVKFISEIRGGKHIEIKYYIPFYRWIIKAFFLYGKFRSLVALNSVYEWLKMR